MNSGSEVTVPGPLWEETPHTTQNVRPRRLGLACFFPPQLCPSLDTELAVCVEGDDEAVAWVTGL